MIQIDRCFKGFLQSKAIVAVVVVTLLLLTTALHSQVLKSPADTGRMTWGRVDFSRYVGARPCDMAIRGTQFNVSRTYNRDTAFRIVLRNIDDPSPSQDVLAIAKACGKGFTLSTTDPAELWSLLRISFSLQDGEQTMAVFDRRFALAESVEEQISVLMQGIYEMFLSQPVKIVNIVRLLDRLDALDESAIMERIHVRIQLLEYWYERYNIDSVQSQASKIFALSNTLSEDRRNEIDLREVWKKLLIIANTSGVISTQRTLLDSALTQFSSWRGGQGGEWITGQTQLVDTREAVYMKKTKVLPADAWTNDDGMKRPSIGKLSLVLKANHNCGTACYDQYNILRQLVAQYGDSIDLTVAVGTYGYAPGTGVLSIEEEVIAIKKYFVHYLKLPVAIGVFYSKIDTLPDGRLNRHRSSLDASFSTVDAIIVDKDGLVRWIGPLRSHHDKRMIDAVIDHIVKNPASAISRDELLATRTRQ